jgi:hypothetical protein
MPARTIAAAATAARFAATATVNVAVARKDNLTGSSWRVRDHSGRCGDDRRDGSRCHEHRSESSLFDWHISIVLALSAYRHPIYQPGQEFSEKFRKRRRPIVSECSSLDTGMPASVVVG